MTAPTYLSTISLRSSYADSTVSYLQEDATTGRLKIKSGSSYIEMKNDVEVPALRFTDEADAKIEITQSQLKIKPGTGNTCGIFSDTTISGDLTVNVGEFHCTGGYAYFDRLYIYDRMTMNNGQYIIFENLAGTPVGQISYNGLEINDISAMDGDTVTIDSEVEYRESPGVHQNLKDKIASIETSLGLKQGTLIAGTDIEILGDGTINYTGGGTTIDENTDVTLNDLTCHNKIQVLNDSDAVVMNLEHQGVLGSTLRMYNDAGDNRLTLTGSSGNITSDGTITGFNITGTNQVVSPLFFHSSPQSLFPESSTRKDYVDGLLDTKQDVLTAGTDLEIVGNTINYIGSGGGGGGSSYTFTSPLTESSGVVSIDSTANLSVNELTVKDYFEVKNSSDEFLFRVNETPFAKQVIIPDELIVEDKISCARAFINGTLTMQTENKIDFGNSWNSVRATINHESLKINKIEKFNGSILTLDSDTIVTGSLTVGGSNILTELSNKQDALDNTLLYNIGGLQLGNGIFTDIAGIGDVVCNGRIIGQDITAKNNLTVENTLTINDGTNLQAKDKFQLFPGDGSGSAIIGDIRIGGVMGSALHWAGLQHYSLDYNSTNQYAIIQNDDGWTAVNSASGKNLDFRIHGITHAQLQSDGNFKVDNDLIVDGTVTVQENVNIDCIFGKCRVGSFGHSDVAAFGHRNFSGTNDYGFIHNNAGAVEINSQTNQRINFREKNNIFAYFDPNMGGGGAGNRGGFVLDQKFFKCHGYIQPYTNNYIRWGQGENGTYWHYWRFNWTPQSGQSQSRVYFWNLAGDNDCKVYASYFGNASDDRIKSNETPITNALDTIQKLKPFNYDKYSNLEKTGESTKESGLIVQHIHYDCPELKHLLTYGEEIDDSKIQDLPKGTTTDHLNDSDYAGLGWPNKMCHINYTGLIPWLIQGMKEQQAMITDLQTRLLILEGN
jgi:hypothetical protein